ncbi:MAG TPA: enterotoxin [Acidobacteriaceae bacterium]|nr:enterotoxin [Acidobacteriaceae bacterium]
MENIGVSRKSVARFTLATSMCLLTPFAGFVHAQMTQNSARDAATASTKGTKFTMGDSWIQVQGSASADKWNGLRIIDRASHRSVELPDAFSLSLQDGSVLSALSQKRTQPFVVHNLRSEPNASRYSDQLAGKEVCTEFNDPTTSAEIEWCGILRDGSNYFRQQITIHTGDHPLPITGVRMLQFKDPGARVVGSVKGSPIADETMFFGFEHPLSISQVQGGEVLASLQRTLPMQAHQSIVYSSVVGVAAPGQMRRDFLRYIERERAHPYRPTLQYNTWYDLGYNNRYNEAGVLNRIQAFGTELTEKRGATVKSFVFDDGWDNPNSLWGFDSGFPDGFKKVSQAAAQYHSHIGVWMSPWGGYQQQKLDRIAFGRKHGYEIVDGGFALSGPKYFAKFEDTCLNMIHAYGANEFKFDGTGNADRVFPGSEFDSDFDAMLALIHRLRQAEPDIFINMSTGTYPSPFWLFDTDDIWRGGDDHSFTGVGTSRQRWITYRDSQVYKNIVEKGPLFPINSLMLHGMIYAQYADGLKTDPKGDFRDEVETFFGSGTQTQEMYITPSLLSSADWNALAKGARWSLENAETLKDVHWIGGDPQQLQIYGWASWSPRNAIIVLRNPSDKPQTFSLDIQTALELPAGAARTYVAHDPWKTSTPALMLHAGNTTQIQLQPWEVRTLEATPSGRR